MKERRTAPQDQSFYEEAAAIVSNSIVQHDASAFRVDVHPQRDVVRVAPVGELDVATAAALQAHLDELHGAGFTHIVLDLRQLTFMDCLGVRLILREDRLARRTGGSFSIINGGRGVQRVLDVCGLTEKLPIPPSQLDSRPRQEVEHPELATVFQCYLAGLRQQAGWRRRVTRATPARLG